jgi:hypothetical protein
MDQSKIAKCPSCKSIIVSWNWIGPMPYIRIDELGNKKDTVLDSNWNHECWNCSSIFTTSDRVTNGVPIEACKLLSDMQEKGLPVVYTEAMSILFRPK